MKKLLFTPLVSAALASCYQSEGHRLDGWDTNGRVCGNVIVDPGEVCDDWNDDNTDTCTNDCQLNVCGDGFLYTGVEQCDDGNEDEGDECTGLCRLPSCIDGLLKAGEACDDGNEDDCDGCTSLCLGSALQANTFPGAQPFNPMPCWPCPLTIEAWFRLDADDSDGRFALFDYPNYVSVGVSSDTFEQDFVNESFRGNLSPRLERGSWHHYAFLCEKQDSLLTMSTYIDGTLVAVTGSPESPEMPCLSRGYHEPMSVAAEDSIVSYPYIPGTIDDLRVSNQAIYNTYGETFTPEHYLSVQPDTVALWQFNSDEDGIIRDLSGNGYDLELVNGNLVADECHGR